MRRLFHWRARIHIKLDTHQAGADPCNGRVSREVTLGTVAPLYLSPRIPPKTKVLNVPKGPPKGGLHEGHFEMKWQQLLLETPPRQRLASFWMPHLVLMTIFSNGVLLIRRAFQRASRTCACLETP